MNRMEAHGFVRVSAAAARLAVTEEASKGRSERSKKRVCAGGSGATMVQLRILFRRLGM